MKDVHVTLPDPLAEEVDRLASDLGETRNGLMRRALEEFVASERKRNVAKQMKVYAETMGSQSGEFIKETEAIVIRRILKETRW